MSCGFTFSTESQKALSFRGNTRCLQCRSSDCACVVNTMEHNDEPQPPTCRNHICRHSYVQHKRLKRSSGLIQERRFQVSSTLRAISFACPLYTVRIWVEGKCEDAPPEIRSDILRLGQIFLCPRKIPTIQGNARDILLCLRVFSPSCRNLARKIFASLPEGFI